MVLLAMSFSKSQGAILTALFQFFTYTNNLNDMKAIILSVATPHQESMPLTEQAGVYYQDCFCKLQEEAPGIPMKNNSAGISKPLPPEFYITRSEIKINWYAYRSAQNGHA